MAVLISGRGSNMDALVRATGLPHFPAEIVLVLADRDTASGLERAAANGYPVSAVNRKDYDRRESFEAKLEEELRAHNVEIVCLAGFMRILSSAFVERWHNRILNVHPSLLPSFPGLDTHERALQSGVKLSGCTVHVVGPGLDDGPIIAQAAVPIHAGDTPETLAARVLKAEHRLYPLALRLFANGAVKVDGDIAIIHDPVDENELAIFSPPLFADQN